MLVICPSRGRPQNIAALLDCWTDTAATARLIVCVDNDDPTLDEYEALDIPELVIGPRKGLCGWANMIAVGHGYSEDCDIIGLIGDDVRPRTIGWDGAIRCSMRQLGIVYGNDLHQREALPTHPFMDMEIVRRLGYMAPPELAHLYIDNFWKCLGMALGTLVYRDDVILEHMHPHADKAPMDEGYRQVNSRNAYKEGRRAFTEYMATRFAADVAKLAA